MNVEKIALPLTIMNIIALIIVTFSLPNIVPIHLNLSGVVDGFASKWYIPVLGIIPLIISIAHMIYDDYYNQTNLNKTIERKIILMLCLFFIAMNWLLVLFALFNDNISAINIISIISFITIAISILFIVLGFFMSSIKLNKHLGIRTPWTLKNNTVWRKTHQLGTYSFMIAGFILIIYSIAGYISQNTIYHVIGLIIAIFCAVVVPIFYSYYEYKQIESFK